MVWSRCGHLFCLVTKQRAWNSWKANSFHLLITIHGELVQSFLSRCRGLRWTWSFPRFWSQLPHCSKFAHVPSSQSSQGPSPSQVLYKIYWNILYYVCYYMQVCVCVCLYVCIRSPHSCVFCRKYTLLTPVAASQNSGRQQSLRITTWMVESCTGVGFVSTLTHRFRWFRT